jgi:hypothetical protein
LRFASVLLCGVALLRAGVYFEPNRGQADGGGRFVVRTRGGMAALTSQGARFRLRDGSSTSVEFEGALDVPGEGEESLGGVSHYALGRDPARWISGVPHYAQVRFRGALTGIDVVYHSSGDSIEFDFAVAPHADPSRIALAFGDAATVLPSGALRSASGELKRPAAWQTIGGRRVPVDIRFAQRDANRVAFALGRFDPAHSLTIDPVLDFATFLGGSNNEGDTRVLAGADGSIYVAGSTFSPDFPATLPAADGLNLPVTLLEPDAFITKMKPDASSIEWSLFYGGSGDEEVMGLRQDSLGNLYVAGTTTSYNLPVTPGAYQTQLVSGSTDAFVVKLDQKSGRIEASTYLGLQLNANQQICLSVDPAGGVYLGGNAGRISPTPGAYQTSETAQQAAFLLRAKPQLNALVYATWFDLGNTCPMAVDAAGNVVVGGRAYGYTGSPVNPIAGIDQTGSWQNRAYVAKLNSSGSALLYASMLNGGMNVGNGSSLIYDLAIDSAGNANVLGSTAGALPQVNPLDIGTLPAGYPAFDGTTYWPFLAKLPPAGGQLLQSTLLYGPDYQLTYSQTPRLVPGGTPLCIAGLGHNTMQQTAGGLGLVSADIWQPSWGWTLDCVDETATRIAVKSGLPYTAGNYTDLAATPDGAVLFGGMALQSMQTTPGVVQPNYGGAVFGPEWYLSSFPQGDAFVLRVSLDNPAPQVQSVFPDSLVLDNSVSGSIAVDLYGSGFGAGAAVQFNAQNVSSLYVAPGHISVPAVDVATIQRGANQITVSLPSPGGGTSAPVTFTGVNASPQSITVTPSSVSAGSGETRVVIQATNLSSDSVLNWNGQARAANYVAASAPSRGGHFELLLEPPELAQPAVAQVTVTNPGPGGGTSPAASFTVQGASVGATLALYQLSSGSYLTFSDASPAGPTVLLGGVGFTAKTQAYWDGVAIPTALSSSSWIVVQPPSADLSRLGNHAVYVTDGPLTSNTVTVTIARALSASVAAADPAGQRLYVLTYPSTYPMAVPADLLVFDMNTGDLVNTVADVVTTGKALAVSANGQYVFIADSDVPATLSRYNTATGAIDLKWSLASSLAATVISVASLTTPPDSPETLIVSALNQTAGEYYGPTIAIFDGPHRRPRLSPQANPSLPQGPMFATADRIYIMGYGSGQPCWEWLDYGRTGVTGAMTSCVDTPPDAVHDNGLTYLTDGTRVMPIALPFTRTQSTDTHAFVADLTRRRAFSVDSSSYYSSTLLEFDLDTQRQSTKATYQGGYNGLATAFVTPTGSLLVLTGSALVPVPIP